MVAGIDIESVSRWLAEHVGAEPPCVFSMIEGGHSNLTYAVTDANHRVFALRRPPFGDILESAHDIGREFRVLSALADTDVPVPTALGMCSDISVNGAPFYVMSFVEGVVPHDAELGDLIPMSERYAVSDSIVDVLAALHTLDPDSVGLGDLGRRENYVGRQLRRWASQWEKSKQREIPEMRQAHRRLESEIPPQIRSTIVHGDFRLGNAIVADGRVVAMLDWELCTLGDPLTDLGYLFNGWRTPDEPALWPSSPTQAGGYRSLDELSARYSAATGADLSRIGYYQAFQSWRLAAILEGVYARYRHGAMGSTDGVDLDTVAKSVVHLARDALDQLDQ